MKMVDFDGNIENSSYWQLLGIGNGVRTLEIRLVLENDSNGFSSNCYKRLKKNCLSISNWLQVVNLFVFWVQYIRVKVFQLVQILNCYAVEMVCGDCIGGVNSRS